MELTFHLHRWFTPVVAELGTLSPSFYFVTSRIWFLASLCLNGDYPIKEAGRDSVIVHPSRSTMDGQKKGVALGGLCVPWRTWCPGGTVVPRGLHVPYCGSTRAWCPDLSTQCDWGPGVPPLVSLRLKDSVSRDYGLRETRLPYLHDHRLTWYIGVRPAALLVIVWLWC